MITTIISTILALVVPLVIVKFRDTKLVSAVGITGMSYILGLLCSNFVTTEVAEYAAYIGIAIAIPLLLFSNNIKHVLKLSKEVLLAFALLVVSVIAVVCTLYFTYGSKMQCGDIFSGMAVALYTGGTPNLNSVALTFKLDSNLLLFANVSDIIFGGVFYAFLLFGAGPLVGKFLRKTSAETKLEIQGELYCEDTHIAFSLKNPGVIRNFAISVVICGASLAVGALIQNIVPALMIGATIGGIALSFVPSISEVKENNLMGQYFSAIFGFSIASMISLDKMKDISIHIFVFFAVATVGTFVVHLLLCKIFKVHSEVMIVTSTAGIYGPAFIPSVSKAIKADYLLAPGLIVGSLGYAIGTFLGIGFIELLRMFI